MKFYFRGFFKEKSSRNAGVVK